MGARAVAIAEVAVQTTTEVSFIQLYAARSGPSLRQVRPTPAQSVWRSALCGVLAEDEPAAGLRVLWDRFGQGPVPSKAVRGHAGSRGVARPAVVPRRYGHVGTSRVTQGHIEPLLRF